MTTNAVGVDTGTLAKSAQEIGDLLKFANSKNNELIEDALNMKAQTEKQMSSAPGMGEKIDTYG